MVFSLRRLLIAGSIVFLSDLSVAQIGLFTQSSCLQIIYIGLSRPYLLPYMNNLELFNEYVILLSTYFLFIYSDGLM